MLLRDSIEKTKNFFNKALVNLKSFIFGGYQKLPKPPSFHPFSCGSSRQDDPQIEKFYADFCNEWECDLDKGRSRTQKDAKEQVKDGEDPCSDTAMKHVNHQSPVKNKQQEVEGERGKTEKKKKKKVGSSKSVKIEETDGVNAGGLVLAKRMKELEMMDMSDMDHVLDIEEALHYYSRLKSPVYVEIVDKFFMDMYSDFSPTPQQHPLSTTTKSKKRLRSVRF
ncbi:uncharacterized protein LOC115737906 [Rhodamnia argentea]|uniref:Uncharacterized protein LOC115737906 n=1 Tax=Rhodamnia argentea TaxID=178133 RepID=A0A8B8NUG7_9MYRT|nr:uncharacterized protein LOC115737906 [Rhodamnia argentea]